MSQSMGDRGPNGDGVWDQGWVTMVHRRLSIIDLSEAGHQPMTDVQLGLTIVFNGCIYNHHELRRQLSDRTCFVQQQRYRGAAEGVRPLGGGLC